MKFAKKKANSLFDRNVSHGISCNRHYIYILASILALWLNRFGYELNIELVSIEIRSRISIRCNAFHEKCRMAQMIWENEHTAIECTYKKKTRKKLNELDLSELVKFDYRRWLQFKCSIDSLAHNVFWWIVEMKTVSNCYNKSISRIDWTTNRIRSESSLSKEPLINQTMIFDYICRIIKLKPEISCGIDVASRIREMKRKYE